MQKRTFAALGFVLALILVAGCSALNPATPTPEPPDATLTVKSPEETVELTWEEVQDLPSYEAYGGLISSVGNVTPPSQYKGVTLQDLCGLVGGFTEENSVKVVAEDGYAMTFSYEQVVEGDFDTYDPSNGENVEFDGKLWVVVAYQNEGEPLNVDRDGAFRLAILGSERVVTDGHWWVKWVDTIEVQPALDQWSLTLEGEITEEIDRGSFETGAAPSCHGTSWTDDEGRVWTGIPLWLLAGRVDDDNVHEDDAFNDALAEEGYTINVIASDGYTVEFDSQNVAENDEILVAYLLDDQPLPEDVWPLRLVGPNLEKSKWVGAIETIEVILP